jgi:hypothetical protein
MKPGATLNLRLEADDLDPGLGDGDDALAGDDQIARAERFRGQQLTAPHDREMIMRARSRSSPVPVSHGRHLPKP